MPRLRDIPKHLKIMSRLIDSVVKERLEAEEQDPNYVKPADMTQWLIDNCPPEKRMDTEFHALGQLNTSFAAIHTTTGALTHNVYDMAAHPEYMEPLREEYEQVLATDGGFLTKQSMTKLKKVSS
jgi:cytochrome P450